MSLGLDAPATLSVGGRTRYVTSQSPRSSASPTFASLPPSLPPLLLSLSFLSCCFDAQCLNPHPCLAVGMDAVLDGCLPGTAGTRTKRTALKSSFSSFSSSTSSPFSAVVGLSKGKRLIKAPKERAGGGAERTVLTKCPTAAVYFVEQRKRRRARKYNQSPK